MNTPFMNERKPDGWSLVAGRFKGTDKTYFYLIRGGLLCDPPLTLERPAAEDYGIYSNPFTIENVLVHIGAHIGQETVRKLGRYLPAKRDLRILVGDELRNTTASYPWDDIICVKNNPKIREAVESWQRAFVGEVSLNGVTVRNMGGIETMNTACNCKNESTKGALSEVLFYWHDEVHDRIGEIIGRETTKVREASTKKTFVEQMVAEIVAFERQGSEDAVDFEVKVARRTDRLCSLLMDWVEVPRKEADEVMELDRVLKAARDRLERQFESLFVRAKVVQPENVVEWLRAVGIYGKDGFDFNVEGDARRFIRTVSDDFVEL